MNIFNQHFSYRTVGILTSIKIQLVLVLVMCVKYFHFNMFYETNWNTSKDFKNDEEVPLWIDNLNLLHWHN